MSYYRRASNPLPPPPAGGYGAQPSRSSQSQFGRPASQQYGYAPPPPPRVRGPPPGADPQLWTWFQSVDDDKSGAISPDELSRALVNGDWSPFDVDTVRMLMGLFDTDRSGTIGFQEFAGLWKYIADWQKVFRHFDRDQSGSIDGTELAAALRQFGYPMSPALLTLLEQKYSSLPSSYGAPGGITFDRFVRACVVTKTLTEAFQKLDTDRNGWITVNYEDFMKIFLSAP